MQEAAKRNAEFINKEKKKNASTLVDTSKRAYYKEFKKVVEDSDVILQVLDARDPLGCRAKHIEQLILDHPKEKRIVLILNKIDLVPKDVLESWLKYLRNEFPTIPFKCSTQNQKSNLGQGKLTDSVSDGLLNGSESLGADNLIQLLKNYCRNSKMKTSITVGIIGYPNVGKSSLINSMKRSKVCGVGSTPGLTKATQIITLDKNIRMIDCPGIVFSNEDSVDLLLRNCVRIEQMDDPVSPVELLVSRCKPSSLMMIYNLAQYQDANEFLGLIAHKFGKLKKGGVPDLHAAALIILQDWNTGKIPYYTLPPANTSVVASSVVSGWAQEFQIENLMENENGLIESIPEHSMPAYVHDHNAKSTMVIGENLKKKSAVVVDHEIVLNQQEQENNPQINKAMKQKLKKQKKKMRSAENSAMDLDDEAYDVSTDFVPLPSQFQDDSDVEML